MVFAIRIILCLLSILSMMVISNVAASQSLSTYTVHNQGIVSFDVSMPIDSTGYILHGNNLTGGTIQFTENGSSIAPLLAYESGILQLPTVTNTKGKPLIQTSVRYNVIKFINPNGINNLFIKIGMGTRTQKVAGLDPATLKDGSYTWQAPIFSVGKESNTVNHKGSNIQFMQIGSMHGGPASRNVMYTQDFYIYSKGENNTAIAGHPIKTARTNEILTKSYTSHFSCKADGLWGAGGADPYRTITGKCEGTVVTFPAGPNLDYEYGSFTFPTVHTPWSATPSDQCIFPGKTKKQSGCVNVDLKLSVHYAAQKIRVPINKNLTLIAES